ncbi:hypothetical protein FH972_022081 [Carpinus fangiana]|uniref:HTH La-type RNA-binding domain-containing protein n=1 Tax=Carpinus fangiana TaxID=176857 RepID=A0A5N6KR73_9ROSI|nr:hypothetical protein FH972_022081 [Carpinus fangiana]
MANTSGDSATDANQVPVFSYAQAAKGKSTSAMTSPSPAHPAASMAETSPSLVASESKVAWADDAADANTVVDEQESLPNGDHSKDDVVDVVESQRKDSGAISPTQLFDGSSASTARDDEISTPNTQPESAWDAKSDVTTSAPKKDGERSSRRGKKDKESKEEKLLPENFKEAPPPPVNFWALRAQTTAPKATPASNIKQTSPAETQSSIEEKSASKSQVPTRVPGPRPVKAGALPSVNDTVSWPTPLTAQSSEEKKKTTSQEKPDKSESGTASGKKSEWVHIPFTPSVKFETPMPVTGRRPGGRPSTRGARGGGAASGGDRASRAANSSESAADTSERNGRSSSLPGKVNGHLNPNQGHGPSQTSATLPFAKPDSGFVKSQGVASGTRSAQADSSQKLDSDIGTTMPGQNRSRRSTSTQQDATEDVGSRYQQKWKSSRSVEGGTLSLGEQEAVDGTTNGKASHTTRKSEVSNNRSTEAGPSPQHDRGETRRGGRGGTRGRGGFNAHPSNGHSPSSQIMPPHSAKAGSFQLQYAQPFTPFPPNARGGYRGSTPRSASIPSPYYHGYGFPAPYDYMHNMYPTSPAEPVEAQMQLMMLSNGVAAQLNYYFSLDNLIKDMFLRSQMDSQGFVFLSVIGDFKRMKQYTNGSIDLIRTVCSQSPHFEMRPDAEGKDKVRIRDGWEQWILPMDQRHEASRVEGPPPLKDQSGPRSPMSPAKGMPSFASDAFYPAQFGTSSGFSPMQVGSPVNGFAGNHKASNRHSLSAVGNEFFTPQQSFHLTNGSGHRHETADSFPDEQIRQLTVVVREEGDASSKPMFVNESSRTFSHGSIDGETLQDQEPQHEGEGETKVNGSDDRSVKTEQ